MMTHKRLAQLSAGYDLDFGGYEFDNACADLCKRASADCSLVVSIAALDLSGMEADYIPWVCDAAPNGRIHDLECPVYAFLPTGPYGEPDGFAWPETYDDGDYTYRLVGQGYLNETDHDCPCNEETEDGEPMPDCDRCDGDGYLTSEGGLWALYDMAPESDDE